MSSGPRSTNTPTSGQRSGGRGWPVLVGVLLAATVGMNLYMYRIATDDPSFAVEPDYYARAVRWDDELAQRRHNTELGWQASATITADRTGAGELRVRLTDSTGASLDGATVSAEAFPVARASQVARLALPERAAPEASMAGAGGDVVGTGQGGTYAAPLTVTQRGRWELRLTVTRGDERFTSIEQLELPR